LEKTLLYKAAKSAVIIGVLGELLGDAGIFEPTGRLQELFDAKVRPYALDGDQIKRVSSAIAQFKGAKYDMLAISGSNPSFLFNLNVALAWNAGWEFVPCEYTPNFSLNPFGAIGSVGAIADVQIEFISTSGYDGAANALASALNAEGVKARLHPIRGYTITGDAKMPPDIVHIQVGTKTIE
jgi:hypothetical protein